MQYRIEDPCREIALQPVLAAAERCGVDVTLSTVADQTTDEFAAQLDCSPPDMVRVIGTLAPIIRDTANDLGIQVADDPVLANGRLELLHYLREQSVSQTTHRYGNLLSQRGAGVTRVG